MSMESTDDFLRGQRDCKEGVEARPDQSKDYYRGYSTQYQHEQNMEFMTRGH